MGQPVPDQRRHVDHGDVKQSHTPTAPIAQAIKEFGAAVTERLETGCGSKEDHLRGPFERLLTKVAKVFGIVVTPIGETRLPELGVRPDYAINVSGARVGYVELKAPTKGVPGTWKESGRNLEQWQKLALLPNVLYTDGTEWALYRSGELTGRVVRLAPDIRRAGSRLHAPDGTFEALIRDFLTWRPERPRTIRQLVHATAGLCRLLRDEVTNILEQEKRRAARAAHFTRLANEWRELLFPNLTNDEFADAYAQTVTFALLLARVEGIDFTNRSVGEIALLLGKKHSLMGKALGVLVNDTVERDSIVIDTMVRIVGVVHWEDFDHDTYLNLFQHFLQVYDPELRKRSGSYYTPDEVVTFMVRFVDEALRRNLRRPRGFATDDVIVVDPAMGTGGFLARVVDTVAGTIEDCEGPGQIGPRLRSLSRRLIGFEKQAAPYAVAELRLHNLLKNGYGSEIPDEEFRFLTDALDNPDIQELGFGTVYDQISRSRTGANRVKRHLPVMVVIGNPPYRERAAGIAPWVEARGADRVMRPNLDAFRAVGHGRYEHRLSNLHVYFWRWGTWKVFDAHPDQASGIVAFITTSAYLSGPGFAGMREYLRRTADEGWVIDLSPEGHRPAVSTRVFPGTKHRICIGIFLRSGRPKYEQPAVIRHLAVRGSQAEKFERLALIDQDDAGWVTCTDGWQDPILPGQAAEWQSHPGLGDLMPWSTTGINPNRTWVYAPDPDTLRRRWDRLVGAVSKADRTTLFKETDSRGKIGSNVPPLPGFPPHRGPIASERGPCPTPVRVCYRSFDRQWIIPDARLHHRSSPDLWRVLSERQVYVTEQRAHPVESGPGLTFAAHVPDMDHFNGRGGRTIPLYRDPHGKISNFAPGLMTYLSERLAFPITADDLLAYIAGVAAHTGYTDRFRKELKTNGVRIPITTVSSTWLSAASIGREVIWLHTYGERFFDRREGRPRLPPLLERARRPRVRVGIPDTPEGMPNKIEYDEATSTLHVGTGRISPVEPNVWTYRVSGMRILSKWFGYRARQPAYRRSSPLNDVVPPFWSPELTGELLELISVITRCADLEPKQAAVLDRVMSEPLITMTDLLSAGVFPVPQSAAKALRVSDTPTLWTEE